MCFLKTYFPPLNILQICPTTRSQPIQQHIIMAVQIIQITHSVAVYCVGKRLANVTVALHVKDI